MTYDLLVITGNDAMRQYEQTTLPSLCGIPRDRAFFSETLEGAIQVVNDEAKTGGVGVIVTDLSMGGVSIGIKLLEHLRTNNLGIPVIIKSAQPEQLYGSALIKKGAFAYYHKEKPLEDLARKVQEALASSKK